MDVFSAFEQSNSQELLNTLLNELKSVSEPFYIILENFHSIRNTALLENISYFVDHLPPSTHLILISRKIPAIRFSRLLAQQELHQICSDDLALTLTETTQYIQGFLKNELTFEEIQQVYHLSEGWLSGILFLVNTIRELNIDGQNINELNSVSQSLVSFVEEEVLTGLDATQRDMLFTTATLRHFSANLCDAVLERTNSSHLLSTLSKEVLFLKRSSDSKQLYRFHHLVGLALQRILLSDKPEKAKQIIEKAAIWSDNNGNPIQAVKLLYSIEDV